jgi:hypothetical protein
MSEQVSTPTSQGAAVSFGGTPIGLLTGFRVSPGTAVFEDVTNVGSDVIGTGWDARVLREIACTGIEPGTVEVNLFGCPPYLVTHIGLSGSLVISFAEGGFEFQAYLETFDVTGSVGQFLTGSARFRIAGQVDND